MFFDAHFHYSVCVQRNLISKENNSIPLKGNWIGLSCAHSVEEWEIQEHSPNKVFHAFGIHPQLVGNLERESCDSRKLILEYEDFIEELASKGKLHAIGETGFDLFTEEFKSSKELQEEVWRHHLTAAIKHNLPLVIHCRKANNKLFEYSKELKKLPAVLFHSFMGSYVEAESLIKRGLNCFFSFGKQMCNNNKKVIECVKKLPIEHLLLETDSPFQTLKGEENTAPEDIVKIYRTAFELRKEARGGDKDVENRDTKQSQESMTTPEFQCFCNLLLNNAKNLVPSIQI